MRNTFTAVVLCTLTLLGCDSAPGNGTLEGDPPVLSGFTYEPQTVAVQPGGGGTIHVPVSVSVKAVDPDGDLDRVHFIVQSPLPNRDPLAQGVLEQNGEIFSGGAQVAVDAGEVGNYTLLVFGVDARGAISNEFRGSIRVRGSGGPPVILEIVAPDTVSRPAEGEPPVTLRLIAVVDDPDGLSNINEVRFWNVNSPSTTFRMFDDGDFGTSGDLEAGDGHFTATVRLESTNQPGTNRLAFQASDRAGLRSDIAERTIIIE